MPKSSRLLLLIIYFIFITILFCLPGSAFPSDNWMSRIWLDKWVHIGIFFFLVVLAARAFEPTKNRWLYITLIAGAYGLLIECMQDGLIPNRSFDLGDWLADLAGIALGMLVFRRYAKK
jgi:VanZ family protein